LESAERQAPRSAGPVRLYRVRLRSLCKTRVFLFDENPHLRYIYASDLERLRPSATMVEEDVEPTVGPLWRITLPRSKARLDASTRNLVPIHARSASCTPAGWTWSAEPFGEASASQYCSSAAVARAFFPERRAPGPPRRGRNLTLRSTRTEPLGPALPRRAPIRFP
jgi:hypothetical protein